MSRRTVLVTLVVSSLFTLPVHAAVEVYSRLHDNGGAGYGPLLGPQFGVFAEPQFDDFGGARTLQKVTLDVRIDSSGGSAEFDNNTPAAAIVTLAIGSFVDVSGPDPIIGAPLVANANATETLTGPVTATTDGLVADFMGTDYIGPLLGTTSTHTDTEFYTTAAELAPYIGSGLVAFAWDGGTSTTGTVLTFGGAHRVNFFSLNNYTFRTTLTYEYVPEPSGVVLLLLSGGALLWRWRT